MSEIVEFVEEKCGLYFRSILLNKGDSGEQHIHDHDHATYCGNGAASLFVDGDWKEDVRAGHAVEVKAGKKHRFLALEDNTRLTCVHDVASADSIKRKGL